MKLVYTDEEQIAVLLTLDEGEIFDDFVGPCSASIPVDLDNRHYASIVRQDLVVTSNGT